MLNNQIIFQKYCAFGDLTDLGKYPKQALCEFNFYESFADHGKVTVGLKNQLLTESEKLSSQDVRLTHDYSFYLNPIHLTKTISLRKVYFDFRDHLKRAQELVYIE